MPEPFAKLFMRTDDRVSQLLRQRHIQHGHAGGMSSPSQFLYIFRIEI